MTTLPLATASRSSWRLILSLPGLFTIDTACHQTGMSWRNAQAVIARLRRQGRIQIVGSERRRHGNRAPVYRVVPAEDRARLRRRARPIATSPNHTGRCRHFAQATELLQ